MNESDFTRAVNKGVSELDTSILAKKVHDTLSSGWPDVEYISNVGTYFVEYKLIKRKSPPKQLQPALSAQQVLRCKAIYERQPNNICVVVTVELGRANYMIYVFKNPDQWEQKTNTETLLRFDSRHAYTTWLCSFCNNAV